MRALVAIMLGLLAAVHWQIWVSDDGVSALWRLETQIATLEADIAERSLRNRRLAAEVRDLKQGMAAVESRARRELGMIGKGEVLYQFTDR